MRRADSYLDGLITQVIAQDMYKSSSVPQPLHSLKEELIVSEKDMLFDWKKACLLEARATKNPFFSRTCRDIRAMMLNSDVKKLMYESNTDHTPFGYRDKYDSLNKEIVAHLKHDIIMTIEPFVKGSNTVYGLLVAERGCYVMLDGNYILIGFTKYKIDPFQGDVNNFRSVFRNAGVTPKNASVRFTFNDYMNYFYIITCDWNQAEKYMFLDQLMLKLKNMVKKEDEPRVKAKPRTVYLPEVKHPANDIAIKMLKLYAVWYTTNVIPKIEQQKKELATKLVRALQFRVEDLLPEFEEYNGLKTIWQFRSSLSILREVTNFLQMEPLSIGDLPGKEGKAYVITDLLRSRMNDELTSLNPYAFLKTFKYILMWNLLLRRIWKYDGCNRLLRDHAIHFPSLYRKTKLERIDKLIIALVKYSISEYYNTDRETWFLLFNDPSVGRFCQTFTDGIRPGNYSIIINKKDLDLEIEKCAEVINFGRRPLSHLFISQKGKEAENSYCIMYPEDTEERWCMKNDIFEDYNFDVDDPEKKFASMSMKELMQCNW